MKRFFMAVLAAVMSLTVLVACGQTPAHTVKLVAANDALAAVAALEEGQVDFALVPEPAATAQLNKHNSAAPDATWVRSDVQALYKTAYATTLSYPQAVVIVKNSHANDQAFMADLVAAFDGVNDWLKQNTATAIGAVTANFLAGSETTMKAPAFSAGVIDGCNIAYASAQSMKAAIQSYLADVVAISADAANAPIADTAFFQEATDTTGLSGEVRFYMPDGAPALAAAKAMATQDFTLGGCTVDFTVVPATQVSLVASDKPEVAIVPVNLASKLAAQYTIAGVVTHGNLFLLGKTAVTKASELADKKISVVNLNAVPGLTLKAILNKAGVSFE